MEIRQIQKNDDRYAISGIYEESWKYAYRNIIPQTYLDNIPKGYWVPFIDNPAINTLVLLEDKQMIGVASYCRSRCSDIKNYGEIVSIYLLPQYTGKGYGNQLFKAALDGLLQMGFDDVFLWVLADNKQAQQFYQKHGFYDNGKQLDDEIGGEKCKELQYVWHKKLSSGR